MLLLVVGDSALADEAAVRATCESFAPASIANGAQIEHVQRAPADSTRGPACIVHGTIVSSPTSTIRFRLDLPAAGAWNSKIMMMGGGGFDGFIPTDIGWFPAGLTSDGERSESYVLVSSDSGHQGRGKTPIGDFSWVANNPTALRNHAYEANHLVLWAAVDLAQQYYGRAPTRRYIIGLSNGGRAGLVAIQRYPEDYDGVISLAPAISQEGFAANLAPQMLRHIFSVPENWMNRDQLALFERGELAACDALDGLKDGILSNPGACTYDGSALLCKAGHEGANDCLSAGQIESIRLILRDKDVDVPLADGLKGYPGYGRGAQTHDWVTYIFGTSFAARDAANFGLADNIIKHGITNDPNAGVMTHDPTEWRAQYLALSNEIDATNPDLSAFHRRGGKLLVWYGISDGCVSYRRTAEYLDRVREKLGPSATREFLRFFTSPAVGHNFGGPGPSGIPFITALEDWVEKGSPPDRLVASKADANGKVLLTRPLCQYPMFPRYRGGGDPSSAASFNCSVN